MKCPNPDCQRIIPDDAKFCKYCGCDTLKAYTEIINNDKSTGEPLWKAGVIPGICLAVVLLIMAIAMTTTNKTNSKDEGEPLKIDWNDGGSSDNKTGAKKGNVFELYPVMAEIRESSPGDGCVQVNDVLLYDNGTMTLGELINRISSGYNYIFVNENREIELNGLVDGKCELEVYVKDSMDNYVCEVTAYNPGDDLDENRNLIVVDIEPCYGGGDYPYAFNIHYAGNINAGLYMEDLKESKWYNAAEGIRITYDNAESYINSLMLDNVEPNDDHAYTLVSKPYRMGESEEYLRYYYEYTLDLQTREYTIEKQNRISIGKEYYSDVFRVDELSTDFKESVTDYAKQVINKNDHGDYGRGLEAAELSAFAYIISNAIDGIPRDVSKLNIIFKATNLSEGYSDGYVGAAVDIYQGYDGKVHFDNGIVIGDIPENDYNADGSVNVNNIEFYDLPYQEDISELINGYILGMRKYITDSSIDLSRYGIY